MSDLLFLLAGILIFVALSLLIIEDLDLLSPIFVVPAVMGISSVLAAASSGVFGFPMSFKGLWLICLGIFSFLIAALFARKNLNILPIEKLAAFSLRDSLVLVFSVVTALFLVLNLWEMYGLAESLGNNNGIFGMISTVRPYIEREEAQLSRWSYYRIYFAQGFAYVSSFAFFYKLFYENALKRNLLIPMFLYIPFLLLSTGRMGLLLYVIYLTVIGGLIYRISQNDSIDARKRSAGWFVGAAAAFFLLFLFFGLFTGKVSFAENARGPLLILAHYGGASIPAFGEIMLLPDTFNGLIGSHTLVGVYRVLGKIIAMPDIMLFLPFVNFYDIDTNIYTALYRYIIDFGILGMTIIMAIFGVFYTAFYIFASRGKIGALGIMAYGAFSYPIFLFFQDERFFLDLFGTTFVYQMIMLYFFYKTLFARKP